MSEPADRLVKVRSTVGGLRQRRGSRRRAGATATEVALILSILVAGMLMAFAELGGRTNSALAQLLGDSGSGGGFHAPAASAAAVPLASATHAESLWPVTRTEWARFGIFGGLIAVALVAVGTIALRKPPARLEEEEPPPACTITTTLPTALFEKRQFLLKRLGDSLRSTHLADLPVSLVMSGHVERIDGATPRDELRPRMKSAKVRHLVVCDKAGKLLGIVSDRDLGTREGATAAQIMTRSPATVESKTGLIPAVTLMINRGFSCLPVVDDGHLVGIFTTTDLLLALQATVLMVQRPDALDVGFGPMPVSSEIAI